MQTIQKNSGKTLTLIIIILFILCSFVVTNGHLKNEIISLKEQLHKAKNEQRVETKIEFIETEVDRDCDAYIAENEKNICEYYSIDYCSDNYQEYLENNDDRPEKDWGFYR
jgi:biopolymer transport protein ExbD